MVRYICQKVLTKQLLSMCCIYCYLTVLTPSVPGRCAWLLHWQFFETSCDLFDYSNTVSCILVCCTLLGCVGLN